MGKAILTRRSIGGVSPLALPNFTYTGNYETIVDEGVGWRIKFKTSGTFTLLKPSKLEIDVFLVGGGGAGGTAAGMGGDNGLPIKTGGGGGGGGYTKTFQALIRSKTIYAITVGSGGVPSLGSVTNGSTGGNGGTTSAFSENAMGGNGGAGGVYTFSYSSPQANGGKGGSDGGASGYGDYEQIVAGTNQNGQDGKSASLATREFGEVQNEVYASGGGGGSMTRGAGGGKGGNGGSGGPNRLFGTGGNGCIYTNTGVTHAVAGRAPSDGIGGQGGGVCQYNQGAGGGGGGGGYGSGGGGGAAIYSPNANEHGGVGGAGFQGIVIIRNHREAST